MDAADRSKDFPIGASITVADLTSSPYEALAALRAEEPVSWIPALNGWFITRRDLAVEAMRDADAFTVDDPRFTTGAVIGESMLSLDGPEHERHRQAFAGHFRPTVIRERFEQNLHVVAVDLVAGFAADGRAELRTALAGPMAVDTINRFLGLSNVDPSLVLDWYVHIAQAIVGLTLGEPVGTKGQDAIAQIHERVAATLADGSSETLAAMSAEQILRPEELPTAVAVVMFGAIETSEGMTANLLWHLLSNPGVFQRVLADRSLLGPAMEESLRLEPAAAVIDRYTTRDVSIGGVVIPERELVTISLLSANRDAGVFVDPDRFDIDRDNLRQHVTFVQGPHGCVGLHLARLETLAAVGAALDLLPGLTLDASATTAPEGLIFRKPASVTATWDASA
jgi:cytochrome P450